MKRARANQCKDFKKIVEKKESNWLAGAIHFCALPFFRWTEVVGLKQNTPTTYSTGTALICMGIQEIIVCSVEIYGGQQQFTLSIRNTEYGLKN